MGREFTAPIIEIFHGFIDGVKNDPIMPDGLLTLLADPFNLGIIAKRYILSCLPERSYDNRYKM